MRIHFFWFILIFSTLPLSAQDRPQPDKAINSDVKSESDNILEETDYYHFEDLTITAIRTNNKSFESPLGLNIVDTEDLLETAPRTPAEALRRQPGIWVQKTGHLGGAPILRGFMGNRVVYLFDGIRRNTAGLFAGPNSYLQNIDALDVDRIEVIRGPGSVLYGSDAIGGLVNVISNERPVFTDEIDFGGRLYGRYSSADDEKSARLRTHVSSQNLYVSIGGTLRDINTLEGGRGTGSLEPTGWHEHNWDAQIDYRLAPEHSVQYFHQNFRRPKGTRYDRVNWVQKNDRELHGIRYYGSDLSFIDDLQMTGYLQIQDDYIDEKYWDSDSKDTTHGFEVQATSRPNESLKLVYGAHYHQDDVKSKNPQNGTKDPDVEWTNPALFALSEFQVTDNLRIDAGVRLDRFTLESESPAFDQLDSTIQDAITSGSFSMANLELDETDTAMTGGLGMVYSVTDQINVVSNVGYAFRAPNKNDMLDFGQFTYGFKVPSTELDPEKSYTCELGMKTSSEDLSSGVTGFYTVIDDAIVSEQGTFAGSDYVDVNGNGVMDSDEQVYVKKNSSSHILAYGVEVESNWYLPQKWTESIFEENEVSTYGNFTWVYGEDKGSNEPLSRAFPANALVGLKIENNRNPAEREWWAGVEAWMVRDFDRIPSSRVASDSAFKADPQDSSSGLLRSDGSVPGFTLYNLRGGVKLMDNVTLTMAVENFTDKKYRIKDSRIDGPGINFVTGLEILF